MADNVSSSNKTSRYIVCIIALYLIIYLLWLYYCWEDASFFDWQFPSAGFFSFVCTFIFIIINALNKKYEGWKYVIGAHAAIVILSVWVFCTSGQRCPAYALEDNYKEHKTEIDELVAYCDQLSNDSIWFMLKPDGKSLPDASAMRGMGLTPEKIEHIYTLLHKAGCAGIQFSDWDAYTAITFQEKKYADYQYILRKSSVTDEQWKNDVVSRRYYNGIDYNDSVIFYYDSSNGHNTFPGYETYLKDRGLE